MDPAKAESATRAGLDFIAKQQLPTGGFASFSSPTRVPFRPVRDYQTTFIPSLILSALSVANVPGSQQLRNRVAKFLLDQTDGNWTFNYWARDSHEFTARPYPDDLDDSFCALSALWLHKPALINGQALAAAVKVLVATETAVGGPYRTWLVAPDVAPVWLDVDLAVNANVAYFISLVSKPLPNLVQLIDERIKSGKLSSPYYPSACAIVYYLARGYAGQEQVTLIKRARRLLAQATSALDKALCLSALVRLGQRDKTITTALSGLLGQQRPDGSWPAAAFCLDPIIDAKPHYNGSATLTTALAIEALRLGTPTSAAAGQPPRVSRQSSDHAAILTLAEKDYRDLAPELRVAISQTLRSVANGSNGSEILDFAKSFNQSLRSPLKTTALVKKLSLANLYGWAAYTILDDFLDETAQPRLLPVATVTSRRSLDYFSSCLPSNMGFQRVARQTFDTIDSANMWEVTHCRFERHNNQLTVGSLPDYGDLAKLAERSLGHALSPLAVLVAAGYAPGSAIFRHIRQAISHYLIARQLNDDAHDWQEDLQRGHITYALSLLLATAKVSAGQHDLSGLLQSLRRPFWESTLPQLCQEIRRQIELSRQALDKVTALKTTTIIHRLLDNLETSVQTTLASQAQALAFLKNYQRNAAAP